MRGRTGILPSMSELAVIQGGGLSVAEVAAGGAADRAGVRIGDVAIAANGQRIQDIIDFRYETAEQIFYLTIRRDDQTIDLRVEREYGEEIGLTFQFELADKIHTCNNKCVFCFIHQMPKKMRRSLYLMDDDYRLSFLHGNYVTLTNLKEGEFERICEQALSPMYVSVHATDPMERQKMLGKQAEMPIVPMLAELARNSISIHAQVVLCPGYNDGAVLEQTIRELAQLHPTLTRLEAGVLSIALVPVGLTKFRSHLPDLVPVDRPYANQVLDQCDEWRRELQALLGTSFLFPTDEWFYLAERDYPERAWYEDFPQFEDGIGTVRTFMDDADEACQNLSAPASPLAATLMTGKIAEHPIQQFVDRLNRLDRVDINVAVIENEFFGPLITIAGLMTGQDLLVRMAMSDIRNRVLIPDICVNAEGLLLDDIPAAELSERSCKRVEIVKSTPRGALTALGLS